ncbi:MAG: hypothetical protein KDD83_18135 [Caldilineaceae bacterium]|nr:hypothetical protein [Caldilineaceae bacterium]
MTQESSVRTGVPARESINQFAARMSTRFSLSAGIIVGLLVVLLNIGRNPVPMLEDLRSFANIGFLAMIPIALISAGWGFVLGVQYWNAHVPAARQRTWGVAVVPVAVAYTLFALAVIVVGLYFIEAAFKGLHLIVSQAAILTGAATAVFTHWIVGDAIRVNTRRLLTLIIVIIAGGIYLTVTQIDDPLWWQISFSYLGKYESNVNYIFNGTLIFAGILLLVWLGYFMSDYRIVVAHGVAAARWEKWVRFALVWLAVAVALVGIFKSNFTPFSSIMHNLAAYSLAGVFGLLMVGARWIVPGFPREFFSTSWLLVALLALTLVAAALGRVNTVGLEVAAFGLGITWLTGFVGTTEDTAKELEPDAFPE